MIEALIILLLIALAFGVGVWVGVNAKGGDGDEPEIDYSLYTEGGIEGVQRPPYAADMEALYTKGELTIVGGPWSQSRGRPQPPALVSDGTTDNLARIHDYLDAVEQWKRRRT